MTRTPLRLRPRGTDPSTRPHRIRSTGVDRFPEHLKYFIDYVVRMRCDKYIADAKNNHPVDPDTARDELDSPDEVPPTTGDIVSEIHVNRVIRKLHRLPYPLPQILDLLLDEASAKSISEALDLRIGMVNKYIKILRDHIEAELAVLFAWQAKRKLPVIASGAAVVAAVLVLQPPPNCYTNRGAPGEPTLCLEVNRINSTMGEFRVCKQGDRFQRPYKALLRNYNKPEFEFRSHDKIGFLGPLDYPFSGPIQLGKAGDECTQWDLFDASKAMAVDAIIYSLRNAPILNAGRSPAASRSRRRNREMLARLRLNLRSSGGTSVCLRIGSTKIADRSGPRSHHEKSTAEKVREQELIPVATTIALHQHALQMMLASETIKKWRISFTNPILGQVGAGAYAI